MTNPELFLKMKKLFLDLRGLTPGQELALLNDRYVEEESVAFRYEIQITKAKLLFSQGNQDEAVRLLEECSRLPCTSGSAAYFAGEMLVQLDRCNEAVGFLELAERQMEAAKSDYYRDCTRLLHAHCAAVAGNDEEAQRLLELISDQELVIFWLAGADAISASTVANLMTQRQALRQGP